MRSVVPFLIAWSLLAPAVANAQLQRIERPLSAGIGAGVHRGEFGGASSSGVVISALGWFRVAPFAAIRGDFSYAHNLDQPGICVFNPCATGAPKDVPALGLSAMFGNIRASSSRLYGLTGAEFMFNSLAPESEAGGVVVPKLGAGLLTRYSMFVEVSGRWRSDWHGWQLRHWTLIAGRYW